MRRSLRLLSMVGILTCAVHAQIQLQFEGLKNQEQVANFYNGGTGGSQYDETGTKYADPHSTGGTNYGVSFGGNAVAVVAEDAGGTGRFNNNPSGNTVLSFLKPINSNAFMNVAAGFATGIAFWYSQPFTAAQTGNVDPISVKVYSGLNGTGTLLATINLPQSPSDCPVDKTGNSVANCFKAVGVSFNGIARSVDFTNANFTAFDNLTLGDAVTVPYPAPFPPKSACPIANGLKSFILEHRIEPTSFVSAFIPSFAAAQLAVFFDPTKEIHTHFEYNLNNDNFVRAWSIALPKGSPPITPAGYDFAGNAIAFAVIPIDKVYTTCDPRPSIAVTGYVQSATPAFGQLAGLPHWIGFSFDPTLPSGNFNAANVATINAGATGIIGNSASVIVVGGTSGSGATPTVVVTPATQSTYSRQLYLDASKSTDPSGSALTFSWTQVGSSPAAGIANATSATPLVTFGSGSGDYVFQVAVKNAAGQTSTGQTTVTYLGR